MARRRLTAGAALGACLLTATAPAAPACAPRYDLQPVALLADRQYRLAPLLFLAMITQESQWCPTSVAPEPSEWVS
ncbi:hypothetical protein E7T09_16275 [Deinococcus sp. KSM4-11]|uniref:hypothetical protein n=1 Tax=Deinococcus sp. KSM4-11 TaxID=2568654 RepID=UPI0010A3CDE6|nr:hypothetical protein [Deinococcus sp. KSM4-11]THF85511.1 hypothetical protein E7T09_16275 [Deinococcus sp. KSM4-11]